MEHLHLSANFENAKLATFQSRILKQSQTEHETRVKNNVCRDTRGLRGLLTLSLVIPIGALAINMAFQLAGIDGAIAASMLMLTVVFAAFRHELFYQPITEPKVRQPSMTAPPETCWLEMHVSSISQIQPVPLPPPR